MQTNTHTPGPWDLTYENTWVVARDAILGQVVLAKMEAGGIEDANLISAAPDLAEALTVLMEMDVNGHQLQHRLQFSTAGREILEICNKALIKAGVKS